MIITIDTHKDDADSIRKAIGLLQALAGGAPVMSNAPSGCSPAGPSESSAAAFAGIFGDDMPIASPASSAPSLSALGASSSDLAAAVPEKKQEIEFY
jgi:hypothetical protein